MSSEELDGLLTLDRSPEVFVECGCGLGVQVRMEVYKRKREEVEDEESA